MSSAQIKRVKGIIPIKELSENSFDFDSFLNDFIEKAPIKEDCKPSKGKKMSEKDFASIRDKMVSYALGISLEELKNYKKDIKSFAETPQESEEEKLADKRSVWQGQEKANAKEKRNIVVATASGIASLSLEAFPMVAGLLSAIPGLQQIIFGASVASLVKSVFAYNKGKKSKEADESEKQRSYETALIPYMEKLSKLESLITENREIIEKNKNTMTKKDFEKWYKEFSINLLSELEYLHLVH